MATASPSFTAFRRIPLEPAYKAISGEMERSILTGALEPGAALPTEQALADRFGVNRSTMREAIRQVESEGLLERRDGRRLFVARPGVSAIASRAARVLILQQVTFNELWTLAITLEPLAARLAAEAATAAQLQEIADNLREEEQAVAAGADAGSGSHNDVAFHALVARASGNRALILAREPVSLLYAPALAQLRPRLPQARTRNVAAHRHICDALQHRRPEEAEHWTRKHLNDFRRGYLLADLDLNAPVSRTHSAPYQPGDNHAVTNE